MTAELRTPALLLDVVALDRNIAAMAEWAHQRVGLRPHAKTHKCVEIARRQVAAGALGVTTATVDETIAMVDARVGEVLLANEVVDPAKLRRLCTAAASAHHPVIVAVDDLAGAEALAGAAGEAGVEVGVLIDVDVGMGRGGVRSVREALRLAERVEALPGVTLRGAMGYEGHAVLEPDRERRRALVGEAMRRLDDHVEALRDASHDVDIVSAGGTNTHDLTGVHDLVTELQTGTYVLMDTAYAPFAPRFEPALSVLGTVVSRHDRRVVLDCGTKVLGSTDLADPMPRTQGLVLRELHEEHALLDVEDGDVPPLGDHVELIVSYSGGTVNLHDSYHVVRDGQVIDRWPIAARGTGSTW